MRTWITELASLYSGDVAEVEKWLTAKHPQLFLQENFNLSIPLSPLEAICYGQELDVQRIVHQLVTGAYG